MAYTKQTWTNGIAGNTPTSAARFNHMEDGIEDADTRLTAAEADIASKAEVAAQGDFPQSIGSANTVGDSVDAARADHIHRLNDEDRALLDSVTDKQDVSVKPFPPVALSDATTIATDASDGTHFRCSLSGDRTLGAPTNPTDGQVAVWELTASSADRTITLASGAGGFAFGADITEVPTISSGTTTYLQAVYRISADRWRVIGVVGGY